MIKGSCLCGGVDIEIDETKIAMMSNCFCVNCRKVSGAAYGTVLQVAPEGFKWLSGEDLVSTYESSPGNNRAFCRTCGSRLPQSNPAWPFISIPAGILDGDPKMIPLANSFTASSPPWHTVDESIPSVPDMGTEEFWYRLYGIEQ